MGSLSLGKLQPGNHGTNNQARTRSGSPPRQVVPLAQKSPLVSILTYASRRSGHHITQRVRRCGCCAGGWGNGQPIGSQWGGSDRIVTYHLMQNRMGCALRDYLVFFWLLVTSFPLADPDHEAVFAPWLVSKGLSEPSKGRQYAPRRRRGRRDRRW